MLTLYRQIPVHASLETLWALMKDLARNPLYYLTAPASAVHTLDAEGTYDSRIDAFGFRFVERIRVEDASRTIVATLSRNHDWAGSRKIRVDADPENPERARLGLSLNWIPISDRARRLDPFGFGGIIEGALVRLKATAERGASRAWTQNPSPP